MVARQLRVAVVLVAVSVCSVVWAEWWPDIHGQLVAGWVDEPLFEPSSGDNWHWGLRIVADGRFQNNYDDFGNENARSLQFFGGLAAEVGQAFASTDIEERHYSGTIAFDADLPLGKTDARWTLGVLGDYSTTDFGAFDFGAAIRGTAAAMRVWKADGECELTRTGLYLDYEDFSDDVNEGDPLLDRTGNAWSVGLEQDWILGSVSDSICERTGPFRRQNLYRHKSIRLGGVFRDASTDGSEFEERRWLFWTSGWVPVLTEHGLILEWRLEYGQADFSDARDRNDDNYRGMVGLRYNLRQDGNKSWRNVDLIVGGEWERRESSIAAFEYDDWRVFAGVAARFGANPFVGPDTTGGSSGRRRTRAGGSDPRLPQEITGPR